MQPARKLTTVDEYLAIDVARVRRVEHYRKGDEAEWILTELTGDASLALPHLGLAIPLAEIYRDTEELRPDTAG